MCPTTSTMQNKKNNSLLHLRLGDKWPLLSSSVHASEPTANRLEVPEIGKNGKKQKDLCRNENCFSFEDSEMEKDIKNELGIQTQEFFALGLGLEDAATTKREF